jgi:hypothetical protein
MAQAGLLPENGKAASQSDVAKEGKTPHEAP